MTDASGASSAADEKPSNSDALVQPGEFGFGRPGADPKEVAFFHRGDDVDQSDGAHHHTLGEKRGQAASGAKLKKLRADFDAFLDTFDTDVIALIVARAPARNLIPNARGRVNQMASTSGTSLALNAYFLDLWRSLTATNAVTWTGSDDTGRVLTVPASKEVRAPVVEQRDVIPDDYVLVNFGTAQARVYNAGGSAPALAAATTSTPLAVTLDGTANVYVEFGPGTIDRPMLVRASEWSGYFPDISYADDIAWAQRYYRRYPGGVGLLAGPADSSSPGRVMFTVQFDTPMRDTPVVTTVGTWIISDNYAADFTANTPTIRINSVRRHGGRVQVDTAAGTTSGRWYVPIVNTSGSIGTGYIEFDARL